jgi:glycosyltransferase involved in cell wall biosynthesis
VVADPSPVRRRRLIQLTREWPPGYGGVERVVHAIAQECHELGGDSTSISLRGPGKGDRGDPLAVAYKRRRLISWPVGDVLLPLPCRAFVQLLWSSDPLLVHLPCPTVLLLAVVARLLNRRRRIATLWHAFLETGGSSASAGLMKLYQHMALAWARRGPDPVITTSEPLCQELQSTGIAPGRLVLLPCCLEPQTEALAETVWRQRQQTGLAPSRRGRVITIGRLESYKRVDWLIVACRQIGIASLDVVGDGSQRRLLEGLADENNATAGQTTITFHGRLNEAEKFSLLGQADLLVLPSASCHEAFGIVQLEAMACGVPALSFDRRRSGMAWVNGLRVGSTVPPRQMEDLGAAMQAVLHPDDYAQRCESSRHRYIEVFSSKVWRKRLQDLEL